MNTSVHNKLVSFIWSIADDCLRDVKPNVEETWINLDAIKIGYEISFNKYF